MKREYRAPAINPFDRIPLRAAANLLKISPVEAESLIHEYRPPYTRCGNTIFIHPDALQNCYLQRYAGCRV